MKPIGRYRYLAAACQPGVSEPLRAWKPIYGWRVLTLPFKMGVQTQVLVSAFDSTAWINIAPHDIELFQLSENI